MKLFFIEKIFFINFQKYNCKVYRCVSYSKFITNPFQKNGFQLSVIEKKL